MLNEPPRVQHKLLPLLLKSFKFSFYEFCYLYMMGVLAAIFKIKGFFLKSFQHLYKRLSSYSCATEIQLILLTSANIFPLKEVWSRRNNRHDEKRTKTDLTTHWIFLICKAYKMSNSEEYVRPNPASKTWYKWLPVEFKQAPNKRSYSSVREACKRCPFLQTSHAWKWEFYYMIASIIFAVQWNTW